MKQINNRTKIIATIGPSSSDGPYNVLEPSSYHARQGPS